MFEHVMTLIWNRRRASRLVIVEVGAAFLVLFVVLALALHAWSNYRRPLGFAYENIWLVRVSSVAGEWQLNQPQTALRRTMDDILAAVRQVPGVAGAHAILSTPFEDNTFELTLRTEKAFVTAMINSMSGGAVAELGVPIIAGRNFGPEDEGQAYQAMLVNRDFVALGFGNESPIGKRINVLTADMRAGMTPDQIRDYERHEQRVVGVIADFRQRGEFAERRPYVIALDDRNGLVATDLFVKVGPGVDRRLEERIVATVRSAASGFSATVTPWKELRATNHLETLLPLRIGTTIAAFLLAMVVLGLIGILWQDVVRRTQEIGVRRAAGASGRAVRAQILLEVLIIGGVGILLGSLLAVQIPLLAIVKQIDWAAALPALGLSAALILLLAAGAALYPAHLASRREPADALRYE